MLIKFVNFKFENNCYLSRNTTIGRKTHSGAKGKGKIKEKYGTLE
jgi:hypothetical protein